ncbi:hypothetical protein [Nonomuraea sp. NEAU-A123]|uniref:hypothetical protein n=1 Tax=Nonomuraea sp. NEAU-A123 TaxID=2839649 RepID=UPI001BE3DDA8|nr:hypothetical protein [Nonomuraea sp. NEAU-A123]MBT2229769.1 hypothetical protein [Nonomuraea sp. NEAU-A123]
MKTMDRPDVEVVERLRREGVSRRSYAAVLRNVLRSATPGAHPSRPAASAAPTPSRPPASGAPS